MSWIIYGAVGYAVYRLAKAGQLSLDGSSSSRRKKKKKKKRRKKAQPRAAHEVLGVEPDASPEEVRHAYQELMRQYHPDRVANAADELRELANARSKEINAAYARMKSSS